MPMIATLQDGHTTVCLSPRHAASGHCSRFVSKSPRPRSWSRTMQESGVGVESPPSCTKRS